MSELLRRVGRFLTTMDAKAATSLSVSIILLALVIFMFTFGHELRTDAGENAVNDILDRIAASPLAILGVVTVYVVLAMTGFPQVVLIGATVLTFGPRAGALYAWIATMTSASVTFAIGHFLGSDWIERFGGDRVKRTIAFIGRHGVVASGLVRVVPSAPFIVVNAAAGAAHIPLWKFWAGTAIGIIPKIFVVAVLFAFSGEALSMEDGVDGVISFFASRKVGHWAVFALIIGVWLVFLLLVRRLYLRLRRRDDDR